MKVTKSSFSAAEWSDLQDARHEASHGEEVSSCKESFLPAGVVVAADGQGRGLRTGSTARIG